MASYHSSTTYPLLDVILHANDVKSCFRQLKNHTDALGAFSYIIADLLYLSCGLTMGSDFSPAVWEICRRFSEQLSTSLFDDKSLVAKHRDRLDKIWWSKHLGKAKPGETVQAVSCSNTKESWTKMADLPILRTIYLSTMALSLRYLTSSESNNKKQPQ